MSMITRFRDAQLFNILPVTSGQFLMNNKFASEVLLSSAKTHQQFLDTLS